MSKDFKINTDSLLWNDFKRGNRDAFQYYLSAEDEMADDIGTQNRSQILNTAMEVLSPRQREAIYLKFVSNLSYEEISNLLEINYQSARNLIFRGVEKLRAAIPKEIILIFFQRIKKES